MSLLTNVITFVLILAISIHAILEKGRLSQHIPRSFASYILAEREVHKKDEHQQFKHLAPPIKQKKEEKKSIDNTSDTSQDIKPKKIKTLKTIPLNIYPLFIEEKANCKDFYEITASLIKRCYENCTFYKKDLEYQFLDQLIEICKSKIQKDQTIYLQKIQFNDPTLQFCWYKVLKGSKIYNFAHHEGFPSLLDLIEAKKTTKISISLPSATVELLSILFTKEIADEIIKMQTRKAGEIKPITKKELLQILINHNFYNPNMNFWAMFHFSPSHKKEAETTLSYTDKETNICFKKTLFSKV